MTSVLPKSWIVSDQGSQDSIGNQMPLTRKSGTPHQRTYVTLTRALQALCTLLKFFPHTVHLATCIELSILLFFREISCSTHMWLQTDLYTPQKFSTHSPFSKTSISSFEIFSIILLLECIIPLSVLVYIPLFLLLYFSNMVNWTSPKLLTGCKGRSQEAQKGLQLEDGARRAPWLVVWQSCLIKGCTCSTNERGCVVHSLVGL